MNAKHRSHATRLHTLRALRLLPLLAFCAARLSAASYWIDYAAGSNSAAGTSASTAWRHCPGDPAATGNPAVASLAPGDTVIFKGGVSYVLTGATGISLRWNGLSGQPITYDGNSAGTWGSGPAVITDQFGSAGLTALAAPAGNVASALVIRGFNFLGIGGSNTLPADAGMPTPARYGGGIAFPGGAAGVSIENCSFRLLGYAFNQRPMAAVSLAGTGIRLGAASGVSILRCDFSRLTTGIEFAPDSAVSAVSVSECSFHDAVVRPFNLSSAQAAGTQVWSCTESDNAQFEPSAWTGYGDSPRVQRETAAAGSSFQLSASSLSLPNASYQWYKDGTALSGATSSTLLIPSLSASDTGDYAVLAANSAGTGLSNHVVLSVTAAPPPSGESAPTFVAQPANQTAPAGASVTFNVTVTGSPTPAITWYRNGLTFTGWTGASLSLNGISSNDAGSYWAVATNSAGSATSTTATLTIGSSAPTAIAPVFTLQPQGVTAAAKSTVTFTAAASGSPSPTYQWRKDGAALSGATAAKLTLTNINKGSAGTYSVVAANVAGSVVSAPAVLTVTNARAAATADEAVVASAETIDASDQPTTAASPTTPAARLVNVSVCVFLPAGREGPALGFVVEGSGPRRVLVRAVGPSLTMFGVSDPLADPRIEVRREGARIDGNDNWSGTSALSTAFGEAGAFPLSEPNSRDAALVLLAQPGAYTVSCSDATKGAGTVLVEVYELP